MRYEFSVRLRRCDNVVLVYIVKTRRAGISYGSVSDAVIDAGRVIYTATASAMTNVQITNVLIYCLNIYCPKNLPICIHPTVI